MDKGYRQAVCENVLKGFKEAQYTVGSLKTQPLEMCFSGMSLLVRSGRGRYEDLA